jgi:signal transduction histidine kinase
MFKKIQYKLLVSYILVWTSILVVFGIAVKFFFTRSLSQQLTEKLTSLGKTASASAELKQGHLQVDSDIQDRELLAHAQSLQWFDTQNHLIAQQGKILSNQSLQNQELPNIKNIILPIFNNDNKQIIGYVRIAQSLEEFDETLRKLDLGLGGGIVIALILSSLGGIYLIHQAIEPIENSFQKLKQFTADASHELRSPLMVIKSNVAVALKYPEEMRVSDRQKFQAIASATQQMIQLIEDLLLLARCSKNQNHTWQLIDLNSLFYNLIEILRIKADKKQIYLDIETEENLFLLGDSTQITRLLRNLIDNALQYTSSGGKIKIKANLVNQSILVQIEDTGIGIAPENLEQIFERFWQVDVARSYHSGGSGLGLAIAQSIAKEHNGIITVKSELGVGSCFTVCLDAQLKTNRKYI